MHTYVDKDLGPVVLKPNIRAKRIIIKKTHDYISVTHPAKASLSDVMKTLEKEKTKILALKRPVRREFTYETTFSTLTFTVQICHGVTPDEFHLALNNKILQIFIPPNRDVSEEEVQSMIKSMIEHVLRHEAKRVLPQMVAELAAEFGFSYTIVKINKSKTRWGSCSADKNINLSYFTLLFPPHIVRSVILHELSHTIELNHSDRFWSILDRCTGNRGRELDDEINKHRNDALLYMLDVYNYVEEE